MADRLEYPFGTIHVDTAARWMQLDPSEDREVWMLNLMRYKEAADYGDGDDRGVSGREADDRYAPTEVLDALGAPVALFGDVTDQPTPGTAWDRIGIVRYPSRATFFAMQRREDFQEKYVHKQAGMAETIVMGCVPVVAADPGAGGGGPLVMHVRRLAEDAVPGPDPTGVVPLGHFAVDGVILGDGRTWSDVRFVRLEGIGPADLAGAEGVDDEVIVVIAPVIDDLLGSVASAGN